MQHFISACLAFEKTVGKILERQHKHAARNGLRQVKFPRWIDCVFRVFVEAMPYTRLLRPYYALLSLLGFMCCQTNQSRKVCFEKLEMLLEVRCAGSNLNDCATGGGCLTCSGVKDSEP